MNRQHGVGRNDDSRVSYSVENFAYGVCFFQGFKSLFKYARPAASELGNTHENQGTALVIGSNVGSEAFYFSLWLRVRTIGVEILCDLNSIAENLRKSLRFRNMHWSLCVRMLL